MSAAAEKELARLFQESGYMRRRSAELAEEMGPYGYKKGDEVRLVVNSQAELRKVRALLKSVGLEGGKPFQKHARWVQPLYGAAAVQFFLKHLPGGRDRKQLGFTKDGRRTVRRAREG